MRERHAYSSPPQWTWSVSEARLEAMPKRENGAEKGMEKTPFLTRFLLTALLGEGSSSQIGCEH
jgi:hypothetical protein